MRAKPDEGWPVFVCLWAKCQRMCCVCLSRHRGGRHAEGRRRLGVVESARRHCQVGDPAGQVQRSADPPNWALVTWAVTHNTCTANTGAASVCRKYQLVLLFFRPVRVTSPSWRRSRLEGSPGFVNCFVSASWPPVSKSKVWAQRSVACCTDEGPFDAGFWTISIKLTWASPPQ